MRTAVIYLRVIVAVSMTSAGLLFALSVEGFQKYRGRLEAAVSSVRIEADTDPNPLNRGRLQTARTLKGLSEQAIRVGESSNLVVSGVFAMISVCAMLAGNGLKGELRKLP